jgi:hypothetical protein
MRITSIGLLADEIEAIQFDLRNVQSQSPYMIRNIAGLDAEDIVPKFYGFNIDKDKRFYDFKMRPRDIVMRIVMNPRYKLNESVSDIRDRLYKAISASRSGELTLEFRATGTTVAQIKGYITKFEVPYFSEVPELQITVRCNDPMFRGITPVNLEPADLDGVTTNPVTVVDSFSTAPHGFKFEIEIGATLSTFTIRDKSSDPEWEFQIVPASNFLNGDTLYFSSEFTDKYLYMVRGGVTTHLLDKVEPNSVWPVIFPGFNTFHFVDIASFIWNSIRFDAAYWGV